MKISTGYALLAVVAAALTGCALPVTKPHATADAVLAAQYRAKSDHGAMGGAEASIITDAYHRTISVAPPVGSAGMTAGATHPGEGG
jgi:hypothetical protein